MGLIRKSQTAIIETKRIFSNFKKRHTKKNSNNLKHKFYIPGLPKCGSTSLEKYLKDKGFEIIREESIYRHRLGLVKYKLQYPDHQTLFIIREPIERIWSHYNYKRYYQKDVHDEIKCSFEETLVKHKEIIDPSNYNLWLEKWSSTKPIVVKLEDLQNQSDFPMLNTTKKSILTESQRHDIINACQKLGFDPTNYDKFEYTPIEIILDC